jgi:hypothetical protein
MFFVLAEEYFRLRRIHQLVRRRTTAVRTISTWVIFAAWAATCAAQEGPDKAQLEKLQKQFLSEKSRIRELTERRFDELIVELSNSSELNDQERLGRVKKWKEEKAAFFSNEQVPIDADLAVVGFEYGMKLAKAYGPLQKKFNDMMKLALLKKDDVTLESLRTEKRLFDDLHLPGRREFLEQSVWNGVVYGGKKSTPYRIRITDVTGDAFNGVAEWDTPATGHPMYELLGSLDGIHMDGRYGKTLRGGAFKMTMEGIVLGRSMVVYFAYTGPKGKAIRDIGVLRKQ